MSVEDVPVIKHEAVQIVLDGTPGARLQAIGEVLGELLWGQRVDLVAEIGADALDRAGIGPDRGRLQPFEPEMLAVRFVVLLETVVRF